MNNYWKFLTADGNGPVSGNEWHLPKGKRPGKWMPKIAGKLVLCRVGYHAFQRPQALGWINARLFEVEVKGDGLHESGVDGKSAFAEMRLVRELTNWNDRTARLFATDCAASVLGLYEKAMPKDDRPRKAIEVARLFAEGRATGTELDAARAAGAAARAAARAAGAAARAAARDAGAAARAAAWAAGDAAWAAARDAAWAAGDAAWAAGRDKFTVRLWEYVDNADVQPWPPPEKVKA